MRILTIAILLSTSTLITVAQEQAENPSADKSMVMALEGAWNQVEIHHDAAAAAAILAVTFIKTLIH